MSKLKTTADQVEFKSKQGAKLFSSLKEEKSFFDQHIRDRVDQLIIDGKYKVLPMAVFNCISIELSKNGILLEVNQIDEVFMYYIQTSNVYILESL